MKRDTVRSKPMTKGPRLRGIPLPALNHEQRQAMIQGMFFSFRIVEKKTHAGTLIERELPTQGRARPHGHSPDESFGGAITSADIEDLIALWEQ